MTALQEQLIEWIEAIDGSVCTDDPEALGVPGDIALAWATVTFPEIRAEARDDQVATCERTLALFGPDAVDTVLAQLFSAGLLEAVPCACEDCDSLAFIPVIPVCECCAEEGDGQ